MATLAQRLQSEIDRANATTSKTDTTVHNAIGSLIDGYGQGGIEQVTWHQCPELVRNYLENVTYNPSDYTTSQIASYAPSEGVEANYKPIGKMIGSKTFYNQIPNAETPFFANGNSGALKPLDRLRWIRTRSGPKAWNVRDLGGWTCDGGTVRYGLLFRGGKLSSLDRDVLVGELGIQHDLDLRGREGGGSEDEVDMTESPLGADVWYTRTQKYAWYALTPVDTWATYLRCVIDAVTHREPVYFHCTAGADRTGTLACVLEGLLGMSQSDIDKDYELTTFYSGSGSDATARRRNESEWKGLINAITALSGDSFRDKCINFAMKTCGMSVYDINAFRKAMSTGTPEVVHLYQTITKKLTGCSIDNTATQIDYGESYSAIISPDSGKEIMSIVVKMDGTDITSSCLSEHTITIQKVTGSITITAVAQAPSISYTITRNLTNVNSSNTANTISQGAKYETTLSPVTPYTKLGAINVTMGGTDISSTAVSGSIVTVNDVSGDLVITCAATVTNIIDTVGIAANTRLSTSAGDNRPQNGYATIGATNDAVGRITCNPNSTIRIKGCSLPASQDTYVAIGAWEPSGAFTSTYVKEGAAWNGFTFKTVNGIVTITNTNGWAFRISLICTDDSAVVMTINEPLV